MESTDHTSAPPDFDAAFEDKLIELFRWRRDERHFKPDPLAEGELDDLLKLVSLAPSVGNSQPWRFVKVKTPETRKALRDNFLACNSEALGDYHGEKAKLYASLKLEGMDQAPEHLSVFVDTDTDTGQGLGQRTMPETLAYSVVGGIYLLWLAARARGLGIGWVSIIDPVEVAQILDVPPSWSLVAHLCIGYPEEQHIDPELHRLGWQERLDASQFVIER
jgi:5,6-dimethylbenzimidazole synthase